MDDTSLNGTNTLSTDFETPHYPLVSSLIRVIIQISPAGVAGNAPVMNAILGYFLVTHCTLALHACNVDKLKLNISSKRKIYKLKNSLSSTDSFMLYAIIGYSSAIKILS